MVLVWHKNKTNINRTHMSVSKTIKIHIGPERSSYACATGEVLHRRASPRAKRLQTGAPAGEHLPPPAAQLARSSPRTAVVAALPLCLWKTREEEEMREREREMRWRLPTNASHL